MRAGHLDECFVDAGVGRCVLNPYADPAPDHLRFEQHVGQRELGLVTEGVAEPVGVWVASRGREDGDPLRMVNTRDHRPREPARPGQLEGDASEQIHAGVTPTEASEGPVDLDARRVTREQVLLIGGAHFAGDRDKCLELVET